MDSLKSSTKLISNINPRVKKTKVLLLKESLIYPLLINEFELFGFWLNQFREIYLIIHVFRDSMHVKFELIAFSVLKHKDSVFLRYYLFFFLNRGVRDWYCELRKVTVIQITLDQLHIHKFLKIAQFWWNQIVKATF